MPILRTAQRTSHYPAKQLFNHTELATLVEIVRKFEDVRLLNIYRLQGSPHHVLALEVEDAEVAANFVEHVTQVVEAAPDFVKKFSPGRQRLYVFQSLASDFPSWLREVQPTNTDQPIFVDVLFFPPNWSDDFRAVDTLYPPPQNGHVPTLAFREPVVTLRF
jgi:hypothetical protein